MIYRDTSEWPEDEPCVDNDSLVAAVTANPAEYPDLVDPGFLMAGDRGCPFQFYCDIPSCAELRNRVPWMCADHVGPVYKLARAACPVLCRRCGENKLEHPNEPTCDDFGIKEHGDQLLEHLGRWTTCGSLAQMFIWLRGLQGEPYNDGGQGPASMDKM